MEENHDNGAEIEDGETFKGKSKQFAYSIYLDNMGACVKVILLIYIARHMLGRQKWRL